jgi:hypothetical protein
VKTPGFFKPRGTHKGAKQPFFFFFFFLYFCNENSLKSPQWKHTWWSELLLLIFFMCFLFLFCVYFHFYIFVYFKKRSKYVALDFSADFFYFVSSFLLI